GNPAAQAGAAAETAQAAGTGAVTAQTAQPVQPAQQAQTAAPPAAAQRGQVAPVAASFSLLSPDIKGATSSSLGGPAVSRWIKTARQVPGTKQYRVQIKGHVNGAPNNARVYGSLDVGMLRQQFVSALDSRGDFLGDIALDSLTQRIPLVLQLIDPRNNAVLVTHRIVLY
ncbi:MAG: hypothetical protein LLG06_19550, partial [Desulfobacteraceae bacterium]|nr:hypothetical protein [Desulfobacteraceae bacterium]